VREEARRRLAAEKEDATKPFDAGSARDILARSRQNHGFHRGPDCASERRMPGRWPSDKTGKTTFELNLASQPAHGGKDSWQVLRCDRWLGRSPSFKLEVSGPQLARWADESAIPRDRTVSLGESTRCRIP